MIAFLKTWANQIVVAVIVATIFEMILPEGNNKKYIKMIIGIYVLFTIMQPVVTKITGKNLENLDLNYKKYVEDLSSSSSETSAQNFENNNSKLIEQTYINNMKNDINAKINQKGYEVTSCNINIKSNSDYTDYGSIKNIEINVKKMEKKEKTNNNAIEIENVNIETDNKTDANEKSNITKEEKEYLREYLSNEYSIAKEGIKIN